MHACMHAYMHACIHACMHTCIHAYMHACIHAYMHTCIHAYMHTCIHAYMHTCIHAYMHTCIHAYMHTCIHAYIHTCVWGIYIPNLKRSPMVFTRSPMVARWSPSILRSFIQSYVVARSSYDGCSLSYDQSCQIVVRWSCNNRRLAYDLDSKMLRSLKTCRKAIVACDCSYDCGKNHCDCPRSLSVVGSRRS